MRRIIKYIGYCLSFICAGSLDLFAEVYLLTQYPPDGTHSALLVTETTTNPDGTKTERVKRFLSKYPGSNTLGKANAKFRVTGDMVLEAQTHPINSPQSYEQVFDLANHMALGTYKAVKLSVEPNSALENNIVEQISIYENKFWWGNNCGQATRGVLEDAGYFSEEIKSYMDFSNKSLIWGEEDWFLSGVQSPYYTESWVKVQEQVYAKQKANEYEDAKKKERDDSKSEQSDNGDEDDGMCRVQDDNNPAGDDSVTASGNATGSSHDGDATVDTVSGNDSASGDLTKTAPVGDDGGMSYAPKDDNAVETDATQYPNDNSESWAGDVGSCDLPSFGEIMNDFADKAALVGPNFPYRRMLWAFSGESLTDSIVSVVKGVMSPSDPEDRSYLSEMKDALQKITGMGN